jgi:integrase
VAQVYDRWTLKDNKTRSSAWGKGLRWVADYVDAGGERRRERFPTKDQAAAHLAEQVSSVRSGTYVRPEVQRATVGSFWPLLERSKASNGAKSREEYSTMWEHHVRPRWADVPARDVTPGEVKAWTASLKTTRGERASASLERKAQGLLRQLCELAVEARTLQRNPVAKVKQRALPPSERRVLTVAQADALVEAMRDGALLVRVLLHTALRRGEAAGLKVGDLDARRGRLRVRRDVDEYGRDDETKSHQHRDVPVRGQLLLDLKAAAKGRPRGDYLLAAPTGRAWTKTMWRTRWEVARLATGIEDLDTHELRHTAISWAIHAGANVKDVQRMAGHASAAMTLDVYGHLWDDQLDQVAERLDDFLAQQRAIEQAEATHDEAS